MTDTTPPTITTRRELRDVLRELIATARELRLLECNPPRTVILKPHLDRLRDAILTGTKIPADDPLWRMPLNPDGTGPVIAEFGSAELAALRREHREYTRRWADATERNLAALAAVDAAADDHGAHSISELWDSLPDDGTSPILLTVIP